jgi:DNA polymerase (family 10)
MEKGMKINEYGVFRIGRGGKEMRIAGVTEEDVYKAIGLSYIEPELRENGGEIEAARQGKLPRLIDIGDIRGDLHVHTRLTDGHDSLEDMVKAAQTAGYEYLGVTEHSKRVTIAHGLNGGAILKRIREIDRLNERLRGMRVLKSIEVDILEDGSLDLEDDVLKELDYTVCAVHSKFSLGAKQQAERVMRAMDNPYFNIFAHPTGRLIHERNPYEIDIVRIMAAAKERGCILELNAHPMRLDLTDAHCKLAKEIGLNIAISTDAHAMGDLGHMRFGILQARRGWLEAGNVVNTRGLEGLKKLIKRK